MLGERLSQRRKEKRLSQEAVAKRLKISRSAVSQWESGKSNPTHENLLSLAEMYGCGVAWLLTGEDKPLEAQARPIQGPVMIDRSLIFDVVLAVEEFLIGENLDLPPRTKAKIVLAVCDWAAEKKAAEGGGTPINLGEIKHFIRLIHDANTGGR